MDFYKMRTREIEKGPNKGTLELYPDFTVGRFKDLMVRGRSFYAIWDEERQLWSTDEYDVQRLVDEEMYAYAKQEQDNTGAMLTVKSLQSFSSNGWKNFRNYLMNISDHAHQLDENLTFANTEVKKTDYVSRRLPYALAPGDISAWDEIIGTLYSVEERAKIEWAIGAIVSGDSKKIQKFLVLYGPAGTGKSTILNIIAKLFEGYTTTFDAKALGSNNGQFATEAFKDNPLVAIQQDGDLSKIEDNTKLNSIIAHEDMRMNEKYKPGYDAKVNAFLFMGTNQPVKISDAKSGIIRRLIDVHPTGVTIPANHYHSLISKVDFELGAIAQHCLDVYRRLGKNHYNAYRPTEMMFQTDVFFNYIESNYDVFRAQDYVTLKQAYALYKEYCADTGIDRILPQYKVRGELSNYFDKFHERYTVDDQVLRSVYTEFNANKFKEPAKNATAGAYNVVVDETVSLLDEVLKDCPAQYGTSKEAPAKFWTDEERMIGDELKKPKPYQVVSTTLSDLDTTKLHFVAVPRDHIIIDFDLKDPATGEKSLERNLAAASNFPSTYAELSKGGNGVHLHYLYDGDVESLSSVFSEGIEVKTLLGNSSLRRRLTKCNNVPVATIASGLPIKEKKVLPVETMQSEKSLRDLITRNLNKEIHPGTKPSVDFIHHILDEAYKSGMDYDVTDMRSKVTVFANNSSNQALECIKLVLKMKWRGQNVSSDNEAPGPEAETVVEAKDERLVFYDVEVYPNLFVICWKYQGDDNVVKMINPSPSEVETLFKYKLVGYNNRRYDNHIMWARYLGYDNARLYKTSKGMIDNEPNRTFGEAYNVSYADIYDYTSKKQSLKKYEIELGIKHVEMDLPWDEPAPKERWAEIADYCANDVVATEAVFEARKPDFVARQILAELSGLTVNDPTPKHTAKIIFGNERQPQKQFKRTDLSEMFPGYTFNLGKSDYRGENPGEGGYVYAEPGIYENVAVLDVASMHPASLINLEYFGPYTPKFTALRDARVAIKHGDYASARQMLDGRLAPYLSDEKDAKALSYALKIVINIVYGLTSAKFENVFRDPRNADNIVAKRGALFMIDLKLACQEKGLKVVHIKTDSIKIPNATPEDIAEIMEFGRKYGYEFEHETTYDRMCLVNDAVYIAKDGDKWEATGAQFAHPFVYKKLFSGEAITFDDMCETKQVSAGSMYVDFDRVIKPEKADLENMVFVGRTGRFVPVLENQGGGVLYRVKDDKFYAVAGTKGHLWTEASVAKAKSDTIEMDMTYFEKLAEAATKQVDKFCEGTSYSSFEDFAYGVTELADAA